VDAHLPPMATQSTQNATDSLGRTDGAGGPGTAASPRRDGDRDGAGASPDDVPFPGVIGHERARRLLARAWARGRLHHSLLLVGPRGIGKATLARALAAGLLCPQRPGHGCGQCPVCQRIAHGLHPDVVHLRGEGKSGSIKTEAARQVAIDAQHAPFEGTAHVVILDPADGLTMQAANALLKAIEEPRPNVHFVLLAEDTRTVLGTLLSRSVPLELSPLAPADVRTIVEGHLARSSSSTLESADLDLAVELAHGVPGVAIELCSDASLAPTRALFAAAIAAIERGPRGVFGGNDTELWQTWASAVTAVVDPETAPVEDTSPPAVEVLKGKAPKGVQATRADGKKRTTKKPTKEGEGERPSKGETPYQRRVAAARLADLWLVDLRERLRGGVGLSRRRVTPSPSSLSNELTVVRRFRDGLDANPNVRLWLEAALLALVAPRS
jgi:DNA polymerase-3 subunit delta'